MGNRCFWSLHYTVCLLFQCSCRPQGGIFKRRRMLIKWETISLTQDVIFRNKETWGNEWPEKKGCGWNCICCLLSEVGSSGSESQHSGRGYKLNLQGLRCKFLLCAFPNSWSLQLSNGTDTALPTPSLSHVHLILFIDATDGYIYSTWSAQLRRGP